MYILSPSWTSSWIECISWLTMNIDEGRANLTKHFLSWFVLQSILAVMMCGNLPGTQLEKLHQSAATCSRALVRNRRCDIAFQLFSQYRELYFQKKGRKENIFWNLCINKKSNGFVVQFRTWVRIPFLGKIRHAFYQARALRALGLLLADGTPTVGGGKTFWAVSQIFLRKQL